MGGGVGAWLVGWLALVVDYQPQEHSHRLHPFLFNRNIVDISIVGDDDANTFVIDGLEWVESTRILAGQHVVVLAAMAGRIPFSPVNTHKSEPNVFGTAIIAFVHLVSFNTYGEDRKKGSCTLHTMTVDFNNQCGHPVVLAETFSKNDNPNTPRTTRFGQCGQNAKGGESAHQLGGQGIQCHINSHSVSGLDPEDEQIRQLKHGILKLWMTPTSRAVMRKAGSRSQSALCPSRMDLSTRVDSIYFCNAIQYLHLNATASAKLPCFLLPKWHMFVINDISEDIVVHVRSRRGADLGNQTIHYNGIYDWTFCDTGQSLFTGEFWWASKYQSLNLFDTQAWKVCNNGKLGTQHCYWLVRSDGFYIGTQNVPFPGGWQLKKPWP
ncbi:plant self-incompatibility S1 [Tanacetum coccineum]